jgi:hypothetical protein
MQTNQVRVSRELFESARMFAKPNTRSINQQIEFWAKLGRIGEANPEMSVTEVKILLVSLEQSKQGMTSEFVLDSKLKDKVVIPKKKKHIVTKHVKEDGLLALLSTLKPLDVTFPDVDKDLLSLDNISL